MNKLLTEIEASIENNKDLVAKPTIHQTNEGHMKSRDKEILVLLSEKYSYGRAFYGHVFRDYTTNQWVSLINWKPIIGQSSHVVFEEYAKAIYENEEFAPCAIQHEDDAFKFNDTLKDACVSLKAMIDIFEDKERMYNEFDIFSSKNPLTRFEMRIYSVYY